MNCGVVCLLESLEPRVKPWVLCHAPYTSTGRVDMSENISHICQWYENAHFWPASSQFVSSYADLCQSESKTGNILVYPQPGNTHPVYWLLHQKPVSCCKMKDYLRFVWKCLNQYPDMPGPKVSLTNTVNRLIWFPNKTGEAFRCSVTHGCD